MLTSYGSPWAIRWFFVDRPLRSRGPSIVEEGDVDVDGNNGDGNGNGDGSEENTQPLDLSSVQLIENGAHIQSFQAMAKH